jgi:hypothetical protein
LEEESGRERPRWSLPWPWREEGGYRVFEKVERERERKKE